MTTRRAGALFGAGLALICSAGCRKAGTDAPSPGASTAIGSDAAAPRPIDRLAPDELAAGSALAFGFPMPQRMTIRATFPDAVHASGSVTPQALAQYVGERVAVAHVEVAATRTIFPKARIKGGAAERVYQFDIASEGPETLLVIRDITPPPVVQGLSQAERWRRAGMTPDGKPLNEKQLQ
ncbi:MAG TPA: hypothetical protein VI072_03535 [Polyangiaceae bacterium]